MLWINAPLLKRIAEADQANPEDGLLRPLMHVAAGISPISALDIV